MKRKLAENGQANKIKKLLRRKSVININFARAFLDFCHFGSLKRREAKTISKHKQSYYHRLIGDEQNVSN